MRMSSEIRGLRSSPKGISSDFRFLDKGGEWKTLFESTENAGKNNHVRFNKQEGMSKALKDLHLDLFNFEEPKAQHSRYVLTSPRSLEACGRFAIKPVELLHKSFEEFVEEYKSLYDTEYSHRAVYEVFKEHERQRLRKLKLCRDERERIIKEKQGDQTSSSGSDYRPGVSHTLRNHLLKSPRSPVHDSRDTDVIEERGFVTRKGEKDNRWASSSPDFDNYHDTRTTSPVWNSRRENARGKEASLSKKPPPGKYKHSYAAVKSRTTSPRVPKTYGESSDSDGGGNTFIPRSQALHGSFSSGSETEDHSPRTIKKPSSAGSLRKRNGVVRRTMSMDSIESLGTAGTAGLSEKDRRIVNLMVSRHEEQQRARKERLMLDLEMAEQKKLEEQLRQARHRQRQAEIYDRYKAKDLKQFEVRARRLKNEHRLRQGREEMLLSKDFNWQMERRKQEHLKNNKLLTKKIKDAETKRKQEENLWQKEREDELQRNMIQLNLLDKHKSAIMNRNQQFTQQHVRVRSRNEKVGDRYRSSRNRLGQQLREQEENIRHEVVVKHQTALMNYQRQLSRKENQMAMSKIKREERIERQQEQLKKNHDDLEDWQKELAEFRKQKDRRALDTAAMTVVSKQQKVRAQLMAKKEDHLQNYEKVKQADEERKRSIQEIIEIKDDRSKVVNTEKEEIKRVNRDAARTSQAVRDIVREQTLRSSFDRMAEAAQRQAFVGRGPQTGHKNKSTLRLG